MGGARPRATALVEERGPSSMRRCVAPQKRLEAALQNRAGVFARARQQLLADDFGLQVGLAQNHVQVLLDVLRLPFLDDQYGAFARAEAGDFIIEQRIGDVEDIERQRRVAERIGQAR